MNDHVTNQLAEGLEKCSIPPHMHEGVRAYVLQGVEPGGFLYAVFSNNLVDSFARADNTNGYEQLRDGLTVSKVEITTTGCTSRIART